MHISSSGAMGRVEQEATESLQITWIILIGPLTSGNETVQGPVRGHMMASRELIL